MTKEHITFRQLKADEIELRVGATSDSGFSLLLYKTARVDANILDETVGAYNWQKKFYQVRDVVYCSVGIYFENRKEWIWKDDAGAESNTEAEKGQASDSFKRAGFAWGIGRELYTSPFVWIKKDENNDPRKTKYTVKEIAYANGEISKLVITNDKTGQIAFSMGSRVNVSQNAEKPQKTSSPKGESPSHLLIKQYLLTATDTQTEAFNQWLFTNFEVIDYKDLDEQHAEIVVNSLKRKGKI